MPANYVLLGEVTLGASAAEVVFANIPQTGYTDLKLVASTRSTRNAGSTSNIYIKVNSITTSVYSFKQLAGTGSTTDWNQGSSVAPTSASIGFTSQATDTASTFGSLEVYIPNYTSSNNKSLSADSVQENNASGAYASFTAWLMANTAAITSLTLTTTATFSFAANSTFYLYGLAAVGTTPVIAPFATGGDIITNDGTYWYHAFLSSGTFTPGKSLTCDVLTVAGGGGGCYNSALNTENGGGGAGGLVYLASQSISTTSTCTVGAGGAYATNATGVNGSTSQFASLTAAVGGGGGGYFTSIGAVGGSGGGNAQTGATPAVGTSGQGNNGGVGQNGPGYWSGGGGGAGAAGSNQTGGAGSSTYSSWGAATNTGQNVSGTYWFAGGGGGCLNSSTGGAGGNGGGAQGAGTQGAAVNATANTGGGGGGGAAGSGRIASNGGSGIIIVRYPIA